MQHPHTHTIGATGPDHEVNRGLIVKPGASAGLVALATDPATEQPIGVIVGGGSYTKTRDTVAVSGPAKALVGEDGLTAGYHRVTCDAASKLVTAARDEASVGFVFLTAAATEDQLVEIIVAPSPALDVAEET